MRIRIQVAKPMRIIQILPDPDPDQISKTQKVEFFNEKPQSVIKKPF